MDSITKMRNKLLDKADRYWDALQDCEPDTPAYVHNMNGYTNAVAAFERFRRNYL